MADTRITLVDAHDARDKGKSSLHSSQRGRKEVKDGETRTEATRKVAKHTPGNL